MGFGSFLKKAGRSLEKGFKLTTDPAKAIGGALGGKGGKAPGSNGAFEQAQNNYAASIAQNSQTFGEIPKTYDVARKAVGAGKAAAIQNATDVGVQDTARVEQSMVDRGLYNTTVLDNARQGVSANVSRQVSDINAYYAKVLADLGIGEMNAKAQVRGQIARSREGLAALQSGNLNQQQAFQQQWELSQNPDAWLESLMGIAGTATGVYLGKNI